MPKRPRKQKDRSVHVYVGGVPANMSSFPSLHGCIRGLKIGEKIFKLQEAAISSHGNVLNCHLLNQSFCFQLLDVDRNLFTTCHCQCIHPCVILNIYPSYLRSLNNLENFPYSDL